MAYQLRPYQDRAITEARQALTQKEVKMLFSYNELTGILTRKVRTSNRVKVGDEVGCLRDDYYLDVNINHKLYRVHRIIWLLVYGYMPEFIDHINHIRNDNRLLNLREVSRQENNQNTTKQKNNKSGRVGVHFDNKRSKWVAQITINGKATPLGRFNFKKDAIEARKNAEIANGYHINHGGEI
jgi:hypothetical protein